ncbi:Na+-driven multidrug efflux pump [Fibrobacter sp. UWCM]|uniref:oligosaccharide flippase family protein n=1 Tax=Fibrobacter sp. UWCM TaxID=1896208 RepID=UPI0009154376|nr:oligosaccharide flippase family protein [Fibrobacter sp. UWCM]SHH83584.1 Na+-driven multidrug efflux pump [Fibrobacter sp. UWCM]
MAALSHTSQIHNNKRIAKNALLLSFRLLITMFIGLYTSRVVLRTLGVEDYGVYNVVAGFVSMFSLLTGSLSSAISRFFTFTLGKGDAKKLKIVFSTSVLIQFIMALFVALVLEIVGLWFLNTQLKIPEVRYSAANWIFHLSVLSFVVNLISIPYNAAIIAHEKMNAFAYISLLETFLKLLIVFVLTVLPFDKLIVYAVLLVLVSVFIRFVYGWYCKRNFEECSFALVFDKRMLGEMTGFAGWNMLGNASTILGTQGINVLMNIFFGVVTNAARGVTNQIEGIVKQFVSNITTAINPQITKAYAEENYEYMNTLIRKSAKYSAFLILLFAVPLWFGAEYVLGLWLGNYPKYATIFLRLALLGMLVDLSGNSLAVAVWASGKIKKYYINIGTIGMLVLPITYVLYKIGCPPYYSYLSYIFIYSVIQIVRLFVAKSEIPFKILPYVKEVYIRCILVAMVSVTMSFILYFFIGYESTVKAIIILGAAFFSVLASVYTLGLDCSERQFIRNKFSIVFGKKR